MRTISFCVLGLLMLAACGVSVGPKQLPKTVFYHLDMPDPLPAARQLESDVVVLSFSQAAALERDGIRYRTSDVEGGYWQHHRWSAPVGEIVRGAVQTDLGRSGLFRHVLILDEAGYAQVLIVGEVIRWGEEDREDGWFAVAEVDFDVVVRAAPNSMVGVEDRVVLSRRYRREERAADQTAADVVRALARALSGLLAEFRKDLATVVGKEEQ